MIVNNHIDEDLLETFKKGIKKEQFYTKPNVKNDASLRRGNIKLNEQDQVLNKELEFVDKYIKMDENKKKVLSFSDTINDKFITNKNIEKDVKRIIISIFIHLILKIFNIKNLFVIQVFSNFLIFINVMYLIVKIVLITRQNNINKGKNALDNNPSILETIDIIKTYKNNKKETNTFDDLTDNFFVKKTFFDNISVTPLKQKQKETNSLTKNMNTNMNSVESSYIPSSKFNYKINNA
ncbi:hypothetical protein QEN19_001899 [Hanseniaspora menglaensis]